MNELLSYEELCEWAAVKRPSSLRRWLEQQGISYMIDKKGRPITTLTQVNAALSGGGHRVEPNWAALEAIGSRKKRT